MLNFCIGSTFVTSRPPAFLADAIKMHPPPHYHACGAPARKNFDVDLVVDDEPVVCRKRMKSKRNHAPAVLAATGERAVDGGHTPLPCRCPWVGALSQLAQGPHSSFQTARLLRSTGSHETPS